MIFRTGFGSRVVVLFGALLLAVLCAAPIFAQSGTSTVTGTVVDAQGNAVPNATVRLINDEKGFSRELVTSDAGVYNFASILPDTYRIEVEVTGFKRYAQTNVLALIDKPTEVNVTLETGSVSETVNVTGDTIESVINTQDATLGNNFQSQQIIELPTDSRNINTLLSLQPGVTRDGAVNGGRADQANFTLDGIDVNDQQTGIDTVGSNGAFNSVLRITAESIEEFRVTTSNPNANQGRSSGAQISLSTRSGTNDFRGAGFYFYRPTRGSANTFFNNLNDLQRPTITRDIFGGRIGGPIVKDRAFFFYSYEGIRELLENPVVRTVPLPGLGRGEVTFRNVAGNRVTLDRTQLSNIYSTAGLNPAALAVLADAAARYPANDFTGVAGDLLNTAGFRFNAPNSLDQNTHILRLDYNINDNQTIFARGNKQHDVLRTPPAFPDTPAPEIWQHNTGVAVGHNWVIGSNKVNNFRYGLTRQAFTVGGDTNENALSFRFVYTPLNFGYSLSRITPVQNFTDDFTWTLGKHTVQFGGNIRIIRNNRVDLGSAFDSGIINPSVYSGSGRSLLTPINTALGAGTIAVNNLDYQAAVAAVIGRVSQYSVNFNYDLEGNILPAGTPIERKFATEEYDFYVQDSWRLASNLKLNFGLRYALSRPVYETSGYQVRPNIPLGEFFENRIAGAEAGTPYNELLQFELAGPKNDAPGFYSLDTNNFQPSVSVAYSPDFGDNFLGKLFGRNEESVFRGGFRITNDYFGQQLAVQFDALSTLGFTTSFNTSPNIFNVTSSLGPAFTGFGQAIRSFPGVNAPNRFQTPADELTRIESSLDSTLVSPIHYNWSATYERKLPAGLLVTASYVGRSARNLLAQRDVATFNNYRDPRSGEDWYSAAGKIYDHYYSGADFRTIAPIAYFENLFPGIGASRNLTSTQAVARLNQVNAFGDWTFLQEILDDAGPTPNLYIHPQYAAFSAFSTVGRSDYHGGSISVRQRLGTEFFFDLNYTFAKSLDDSSGLQTSGSFGTALILNPIRQQDSYAVSDFDVRHNVNANAVWQVPFGRGRRFFGNANKLVDALIGGFQLGGVFRYNTGLPFSTPIDLSGWATNWQIRSRFVRTAPISTTPYRGGADGPPNVFRGIGTNDEATRAFLGSLRPPRPGETGDRNVFRATGFSVLDLNLVKSFVMPWSERHRLQFRGEVFNVLNFQYLAGQSAFSITPDLVATDSILTSGSGAFNTIRGNPRRFQFGLRYEF